MKHSGRTMSSAPSSEAARISSSAFATHPSASRTTWVAWTAATRTDWKVVTGAHSHCSEEQSTRAWQVARPRIRFIYVWNVASARFAARSTMAEVMCARQVARNFGFVRRLAGKRAERLARRDDQVDVPAAALVLAVREDQ